jgi:cytidylate kinase
MAAGDAEKRIKQSDHNRQAFYRRYFKIEPEDPAEYDLVMNAARVSTQMAVRLIGTAVQERAPRPG